MNLFQELEARVLIADLDLPEGSRGLDVGSGVGLFALWLAEAIGPRGRVAGIEPSTERVEAARALADAGAANPFRLPRSPKVGDNWRKLVKRDRVRFWAVEYEVMKGWRAQMRPDTDLANQDRFWKWVRDNVDYRVRRGV